MTKIEKIKIKDWGEKCDIEETDVIIYRSKVLCPIRVLLAGIVSLLHTNTESIKNSKSVVERRFVEDPTK